MLKKLGFHPLLLLAIQSSRDLNLSYFFFSTKQSSSASPNNIDMFMVRTPPSSPQEDTVTLELFPPRDTVNHKWDLQPAAMGAQDVH